MVGGGIYETHYNMYIQMSLNNNCLWTLGVSNLMSKADPFQDFP